MVQQRGSGKWCARKIIICNFFIDSSFALDCVCERNGYKRVQASGQTSRHFEPSFWMDVIQPVKKQFKMASMFYLILALMAAAVAAQDAAECTADESWVVKALKDAIPIWIRFMPQWLSDLVSVWVVWKEMVKQSNKILHLKARRHKIYYGKSIIIPNIINYKKIINRL